MSMAFQVTQSDVAIILNRHGIKDPAVLRHAVDAVDMEAARVEQAALAYTDFDEQTDSALDEIETILIEEGVICGEKKFSAP